MALDFLYEGIAVLLAQRENHQLPSEFEQALVRKWYCTPPQPQPHEIQGTTAL